MVMEHFGNGFGLIVGLVGRNWGQLLGRMWMLMGAWRTALESWLSPAVCSRCFWPQFAIQQLMVEIWWLISLSNVSFIVLLDYRNGAAPNAI